MYIALMNGTKEQARAQGDWSQTVFFDTSGFRVTHLALIDEVWAATDPVQPLEHFIETIQLPKSVDCRVRDIPIVRNKQLILGQPVCLSADITDKVDADVM